MFADFQSHGTAPVLSDWVQSPLSIGANSSAHDFKIIEGTSSGPEALLVDKLVSRHLIPWSVIVKY